MFETITLATNDGRIRQAWNKLIRKIQTDVEHKRVWNAAPSPRVRGEVVYAYATDRYVAPASAAVPSAAAGMWVGVITEPMVGTAGGAIGTGIMRTQGLAYVKFDNGLTLVGGTGAYVSAATPGNATNSANLCRIGTIADATGYVTVTNPYAWVWLGRCCTPLGGRD